MLAETVFERAQGNIDTAVTIIDTARAMLVEGAGAGAGAQGPMMAKDGAYLYRQDGGTMSDTDTLRAMIMANLQGQEGRTLSDRDIGQQGRTLSDADLVQLLDDIRITKGN